MSVRLIINPVSDEQRDVLRQAVYCTKYLIPINTPIPGGKAESLVGERDWQITTRRCASRQITVVWMDNYRFDEINVHDLFGYNGGYINTQSIVWVIFPDGRDFYFTGDFEYFPQFHGIFNDLLVVQMKETVYCISTVNDLQVTQTFTLSQELGLYKIAEISVNETGQFLLHVGYLPLSEVDYYDSYHNDSLSTIWETFEVDMALVY